MTRRRGFCRFRGGGFDDRSGAAGLGIPRSAIEARDGAFGVTGKRLSRADWVAAARKALVASGIDDVKVDVLARRLKVTRGSFYHHFNNRQSLLDALLADWAVNNQRELDALRGQGAGIVELFRIWLGEDPEFPAFDIAIRVWARKSRSVAALVGDIDDGWVALIQAMLERDGIAAPESFVRARIVYFHQIGYYALSITESRADRLKLAPYYYQGLTGMAPPPGFDAAVRPPPRTRRTAAADVGA